MDYFVFDEALYQYSKSEESKTKSLWEAIRFCTATLLRPNLKDSSRPIDEICPLPWDNEKDKIKRALDIKACDEALDALESLLGPAQ